MVMSNLFEDEITYKKGKWQIDEVAYKEPR
jgi:hypothetical protein